MDLGESMICGWAACPDLLVVPSVHDRRLPHLQRRWATHLSDERNGAPSPSTEARRRFVDRDWSTGDDKVIASIGPCARSADSP